MSLFEFKFENQYLSVMENLTDRETQLAVLAVALAEEDSSDEELETLLSCRNYENILLMLSLQLKRNKRNCVQSYVDDVVPTYTAIEFRTHFRVSSDVYKTLTTKFENSKFFVNLRYDKRVNASKHMLVFLWFAGHEACSFRDVGDRFDICIATVHRVITRVTMFLCFMADEVITWPDSEGMTRTSTYFHGKYGFPNTIGAIDGTHIVIDPPKEGKDDYIDRKGSTSICMQAICDHNNKFIDIFVGYPGSVHDSRVFKNSFIYPKFERVCKDYYIVGDSAYPLMANLLTPYRDNGMLTAAQELYNKKLSSCRVVIEHSFGMLKQRFRQLYYCKLKGMDKLCYFIKACCVLHNLCSTADLPFTEELENTPDQVTSDEIVRSAYLAKLIRDHVCAQIQENKST